MLKLKDHLYQSLANSNADFENPNEEEIIGIGGNYQSTLGKIYETISIIENLEDMHLNISFGENIEDIASIKQKLTDVVNMFSNTDDKENPFVKLLNTINQLYHTKLEKEDILNFLSSLEYVQNDLKKIDCPDFDCNTYDLLVNNNVIETLKEIVK